MCYFLFCMKYYNSWWFHECSFRCVRWWIWKTIWLMEGGMDSLITHTNRVFQWTNFVCSKPLLMCNLYGLLRVFYLFLCPALLHARTSLYSTPGEIWRPDWFFFHTVFGNFSKPKTKSGFGITVWHWINLSGGIRFLSLP